jgi:hypothetical protein
MSAITEILTYRFIPCYGGVGEEEGRKNDMHP